MTAKQMAQQQRDADLAHHTNRVRWLEPQNAAWVCGTPVAESDKRMLLRQSREFLRDPAGSFNHCNCQPRCA